MKTYIVPLEGGRQASKPEVGGKGLSLLWLARQEFKTAPGFIVATEAFIDGQFGGAKTQSQIEEAIREAYQQLGGRVAIRSSMVAEDSADASFAGQLDTHLNIEGADAVIQTVRACWASMANPRVSEYLKRRNGAFDIAMAVVVQKMVEARAAGVAFSADPISGEDVVVIEATAGLGDAVAGGTVNPDRWVVDSQNNIVESIQNSETTPALTTAQAQGLAALIRQVALKANSPQDVEWARDETDFILLQARPITSLAGKDVYSSKFVSEMVPGLIKPLVWSTTTSAIAQNVFARVFDELLGAGNVDASKLLKRIHSRVYANVTLLGKACEQLGLPANFFETITRGERPTNVRKSFLSFNNLTEKVRLLRFIFRNRHAAPRVRLFIERRGQELEPFRRTDWDSKSSDELLASLDQLREYHGEVQWHIFITALNMSVRNRLLGRMIERATGDAATGDLLSGAAPSQALGANHALQEMAGLARELDVESQQMLFEGDNPSIRRVLSASEEGGKVARKMDEFQSRYGFLSANGTDFSLPAWRETPALVWQMVGRMVKQLHSSAADSSTRRQAALQTVRSKLSPFQRRRFEALLAATINFMDLRERVSQLISEDAYLMRCIYLALANQLVRQNKLSQRDDIFYLSHEEVVALARGEINAEEANRLIEARQIELRRDAELDPPEILRGEMSSSRVSSLTENDSDVLTGISGSAGVVEGRARIVRDPSLAPRDLSRSDILIVPFTDVGWTPLLAGIGGIVAETGGQLSHTAIVAREYGLPAVVSVKRATQRVREGQWILVDGAQGRVHLKQEAEA
jgi:pyruvate,water dikinase